tara:strand:+ start:439 stop:597 length:159 start_codon:yes stop_codon:yes gene_type:complete
MSNKYVKISGSGELMGEPPLNEPDEDEPDLYGQEEFDESVEDGDTDPNVEGG